MKDFQPLVSVIINCFNGETYLREAIDSVIAQTYKNWEIVFWDNQSTDSTSDIVKSYNDSRIHYYYSPTHTALGEARNLAVEKANGDYINFLDADDVWALNKLEEQIKLIVPDKCEVVYTPFNVIFEDQFSKNMRSKYTKHIKHICFDGNLYEKLLVENYIIFSSVLIRKELFSQIGGVNTKFQQYEDWELLLKASLLSEFAIANKTRTYYRIHGNNNTSKNGITCIDEMRDILNSLPPSNLVENAKKRNETRFACHYYIRKWHLIDGFKHIFKKGSWSFLFAIFRQITKS